MALRMEIHLATTHFLTGEALRSRQGPLSGRALLAALNVALLHGWGIHEGDVSITGRRHPEG
jgi:hypothetical protein